jgi:hypothetical protein
LRLFSSASLTSALRERREMRSARNVGMRCKDRFGKLSRSVRAMYKSWCIAWTSVCAELQTCAAKQKRRRKSRGNRY